MKTKDKLILIFILFLAFSFFSIQNSFAKTNENCETRDDIPADVLGYDFFYSKLPTGKYNFLIFTHDLTDGSKRLFIAYSKYSDYSYAFINSSGTICLNTANDKKIIGSEVSGITSEFYGYIYYDIKDNIFTFKYQTSEYRYSKVFDINTVNILYTTTDRDILYGDLYSDQTTYYSNFYDRVTNIPDKLNLFELNLTDLDYNNQIHKFNLSTYTNSECYDEIMRYYNNNNQYVIYITDYQRILTYGEEDNDDSFQYGSYMLSGYIDFLTQDDAVFFYDKEEQKIRVGTGIYDSIIPTDKPIKRFYYKLTYSEDSNDPNVEIWTNNGNLFPVTVSQIDNSYFVGSSQTIYYASNTYNYNMYFRDFSVYYKGYLNPFAFGEKVRDISSRPFYVYNFSFGGGTTKLLFSNSSTYTEDIENIYNDAQNIYDKDEIPKDSGGGTSYIQGQGSTSSTYNEFNVTDDTTPEEDAEHEDGIRTPTTNSSEDRSDWGVLDYLKYIVDKIISIPENILKGLYNLFIPTDGQWADIKQSYIDLGDLVSSKLPFVSEFKTRIEEAQNEVFASNDFLNITMPSFSYMGGETQEQQIFNVRDAYEPYRIKIRSLLALVVYGCGFVYVLKTVLNYNATAAGITQSNIFNDMKKGGK